MLDEPGDRPSRGHLIDRVFFLVGTLATLALALSVLRSSVDVTGSLNRIVVLVVFWLVLAYLALPRLNRILAAIYVPGYFIGRTRTSDGLLGDPLNLAFRGTGEELSSAMLNAGWTLAEEVTTSSSVRIVTSTLFRRPYPTAPVSPLMLFGRKQDASWQQEVAGSPAKRHHVRFWRAPEGWLLPGGHRVDWLAAGTYDRRVGLSLFTLQVTHKIDADIDVERDHVVESVIRANPSVQVEVLDNFTAGYHSRNGGGDEVHTDGDLPVVDVSGLQAAAGATPMTPDPGRRMPVQIGFSVLLVLVLAITVWSTTWLNGLARATLPDGDAWTLTGIRALAVLMVLVAVAMLRRDNAARRILLLGATVVVVLQIWRVDASSVAEIRENAALHTALGILLVVALSSPAATAWCEHERT